MTTDISLPNATTNTTQTPTPATNQEPTPNPSNSQTNKRQNPNPAINKPQRQRQHASQNQNQNQNQNQPQPQKTLRNPPFTYLNLQYLRPTTTTTTTTTQPPNPHLDALTTHLTLQTALTRFLGLHGSAIAVDILALEATRGEVWVRVGAMDRGAFVAAVGGWVGKSGEGWRVKGWESWGVGGAGEGGRGLFD
ncbi:hypothetical protein MBLNU230_g6454t1 [Neophaeotheca triangularis]